MRFVESPKRILLKHTRGHILSFYFSSSSSSSSFFYLLLSTNCVRWSFRWSLWNGHKVTFPPRILWLSPSTFHPTDSVQGNSVVASFFLSPTFNIEPFHWVNLFFSNIYLCIEKKKVYMKRLISWSYSFAAAAASSSWWFVNDDDECFTVSR